MNVKGHNSNHDDNDDDDGIDLVTVAANKDRMKAYFRASHLGYPNLIQIIKV